MAADHIAETLERLAEAIAPIVEREGFELFDMELKRSSKGHLLRVTIDVQGRESYPEAAGRAAAGETVGIHDCVRVAKALGPVLDVEDLVPGKYTLEVSSPGVNRVLKTPRHFELAVGRKVRVKTRIPVEGESFFIAPLVAADADRVVLDVRGSEVEVPYRLVSRAILEAEF